MDITRSFIETAVSKALHDIQRDPDRSIRNIVDLGTNFSKGRFQKRFLETAQTMLQTESSAYYALAKRVVAEVNHDTLRTFGINMGYNSFTRGAKTIRAKEAALLVNIPWTLAFAYRGDHADLALADIDKAIQAGKALGIYTYIFFCESAYIQAVSTLFGAHPDCAFVLFLLEGMRHEAAIPLLTACPNLMVALPARDAAFAGTAEMLHGSRCLYAAYARYSRDNVQAVLTPAWLEDMAAAGCTFALLLAAEDTPPEAQQAASAFANAIRGGQQHPIFLLDFYSDLLAIDQVISDQPCFMAIDGDGMVQAPALGQRTGIHLRDGSLLDILSRVMPRVSIPAQSYGGNLHHA